MANPNLNNDKENLTAARTGKLKKGNSYNVCK